MDGNRFDDITRRLAADASRRTVLKRGAAAVAALTGLGGATAADAARRPTPTPKPVTCPGAQTWNGSACGCPGGTNPCGPDCCPAGAPCCNNACCYGTCYGEELCCPTGQLVCNGACLAPGQCCADSDCGSGLTCAGNVCVCVATTSCQTAGLSCGTFTDDCGAINDCGACETPSTCGGGGTEGVCGCLSQPDCTDKCGPYLDACGVAVDCPYTCGDCQYCGDDSQCAAIEDGTECEVDDLCQVGSCSGGACVSSPKTCAACEICRNGECVADDACVTCDEGLQYYNGHCCNMPTIGGSIPAAATLKDCAETDSICCGADQGFCCPGTGQCCDMCVIYNENGVERTKCCEPENICGENCCWFGHTCVNGACVESNSVCAGDVVCDDVCCGGTGAGTGTCCGSGSFCVAGVCKPATTNECVSHDECVALYGSGAVCAGLDFYQGPPPQQVKTAGVCCPDAFSFQAGFGGIGPIYACCATNARPMAGGGCCGYPFHTCYTGNTCSCSRTTVRRWGR